MQPADGYLANEEIYPVRISENGQAIGITVVNDRIPEIKTNAAVDGKKEICATEVFTLTDTVSYSHLIPGKEYVLKGTLMDKNTGKAFTENGEAVTAETVFTPETPNGTVTVSFTFDSRLIKENTSLVVFETLYKDGKELAVHADIEDEDQTVKVTVPEIGTKATVNGEKSATAKDDITIEDTVFYKNLTVGKEYTVKGILMDKATGKPFLVNGKEVTSEVTFTAEKKDGEITVRFTFDGSKVTKQTDIVVFETLYRDGVEIAAHADVEDGGQTVTLTPPLAAYGQDIAKNGSDPLRPLFNRALLGTYPPGSTFKMVTAIAGLEEGIITPSTKILDKGAYTYYPGTPPKCWIYRQHGTTHGLVNVSEAIKVSCNYFFFDVGRRLGIDRLVDYATRFGLGEKTGIELTERSGVMASREYTESLGQKWYDGNTLSVAIGQENSAFTPIQLANYIATLVNGGTRYSTHLLKEVKVQRLYQRRVQL